MVNFYDNIESYLLNELSGKELSDFENALQHDLALAQSVAQHREMLQRLDGLRLRNKIKAIVTEPGQNPVSRLNKPFFFLLAALLILFSAAIWWFNRTASEKAKSKDPIPQNAPITTPPTPVLDTVPPIQNPDPNKNHLEKAVKSQPLIALARAFQEEASPTFIRDANLDNEHLSVKTPAQLAAEALFKHDYSSAAHYLKADELVVKDENARYIRANARFGMGRFAGAALDFQALETSFQFKHEARWNYLLCQIALGNTDLAKKLLAEVLADPDYPFREKALKLRGKLKAH